MTITPFDFITEQAPTQDATSFAEKTQDIKSAVMRNIARTASNVGTFAAGIPGSTFSAINMLAAKPIIKAITGKEGLEYEETPLGKIFPTIEAHRKNIEQATGGYLKPQNEAEKFFDSAIDTMSSLYLPGAQVTRGGRAIQGAEKVFRNFAKGVGAEILAKTAKDMGGSESTSSATRMGSLFLMSVFDKPTAARQVSNLYRAAEQSIPEGATTNAVPLQNNLNRFLNTITRGRPQQNLSAPERFLVQQGENVLNLIQNGKIGVQQAWAQLKSINQELQTILPALPWQARKGIRTQVTRLNGALNQTLDQYGNTNRAFAETFRPAQEAFGTMARSHFIGNWVQSNIKNPYISEALLHLFGAGFGTVAVQAVVPYRAIQLGYRIANSPTLARIYARTWGAASRENVTSFNKNVSELNQKIQEKEKEEEQTRDIFKYLDNL